MSRLQRRVSGFSTIEVIFVLLIVLALGLVGYFILHKHSLLTKNTPPSNASNTSPSTTTTSKTDPYAVLSPATLPSKTAECSQPLTFDSSGNSGPVQCSNGELNILEWNALSALEPTVMTLGYSPTIAQVQSDLCSDANASSSDANTKNSYVVEATVYQISALYYGWSFSTNPTSVLTNNGC